MAYGLFGADMCTYTRQPFTSGASKLSEFDIFTFNYSRRSLCHPQRRDLALHLVGGFPRDLPLYGSGDRIGETRAR